MLRVALVNVPFASWDRPSFALSQLAGLLRREFGGQVVVDVHYLNQDVATHLGAPTYESISLTHDHVDTGLGDWLFRSIAFPGAPDNSEEYFNRYYRGQRWAEFRERILCYRDELPGFLATLVEQYRLAEADIVGFSSMFAQHVSSLALARLVKDRNPGTLTLLGGANCEAPMGAVIAERVPAIDYVFSGPALETFPRFVRCALDGDLAAADAVTGIVSRRNCGDPRFRQAVGPNHDIDDVLRPEYDSFLGALGDHPDLARTGNGTPTLYFETSRGCWWGERSHCTFCGLNGQTMAYRSMRADLAIEQFEWLFEFAPQFKSLSCTDNILPRSYPRDVFPHLEPPPGVSIFYEVKLPLSRRDLTRLVAGGVTVVQPGIEALATRTLKLMGKGTTAFQNLQFLKSCADLGIDPQWNLLIGFPGEDNATLEQCAHEIPRLAHLRPPYDIFMVRFDRFSPYFVKRDEFGLDLHPMDYYPLTYPFPPEALADLAYFFADHSLAPYMLNALEWHDRLRVLVATWRRAWSEGAKRPELRLVGSSADGWQIRDSRWGEVTIESVDEETCRLLRRLSSPARPDQLADDFGGRAALDRRLRWLDERNLLFEEEGRVLSLVLTDGDDAEADNAAETSRSDRPLLPVLPALAGVPRARGDG
jgi:ribosomal peptide maturation radical SAM protein 1